MIETDFCYLKDMKGLRFNKGIKKKNVKGYLLNDTAFVNLSARQWKDLNEIAFINAVSNTIIHETMHYLQKGIYNKIEVEERICELMADQSKIKEQSLRTN